MQESFEDSGGTPGTYGSPRVCEDLVEAGWKVSVNTVAASMARQGLRGRAPKRRRRCLTRPDKAAAPIPDLIKRDFHAERIDQRWCGDLTEIPTDEGKLYLATVLDLASRRLPGFAISEHHDSAVAKAALCMAAAVRGGDVTGVVFHSDKGGEYVGDLFAAACRALGVTQSMGRVGSALDNAAAESWNSTLEHELLSRRHFATKDQARREVARFIDVYNHRRRHSQLRDALTRRLRAVLADRAADDGPHSRRRHETGPSDRHTATNPTPVASGCGRMRSYETNQEPSTVPGEAHIRARRGSRDDRRTRRSAAPLRFVAGADAVAAVEHKANDLLAQIDAHRVLHPAVRRWGELTKRAESVPLGGDRVVCVIMTKHAPVTSPITSQVRDAIVRLPTPECRRWQGLGRIAVGRPAAAARLLGSGAHADDVAGVQGLAGDAPVAAGDFLDGDPRDGPHRFALDADHGVGQLLDDCFFLGCVEDAFDEFHLDEGHGSSWLVSVGCAVVVRREMSLGQEARDQLVEVVWALQRHEV